jgi:hypothetical protein
MAPNRKSCIDDDDDEEEEEEVEKKARLRHQRSV